jgi:hypothetical protein
VAKRCSRPNVEDDELADEMKAAVTRIGDGSSGGAPAADRGAGSLVRPMQAMVKMTWH